MNAVADLDTLREQAAQRASELSLPSNKSESWRYVDLKQWGETVASDDRPPLPSPAWQDGAFDLSTCDSATLPAGVSLSPPSNEDLQRWQQRLASTTDIAECWTWSHCHNAVVLTITDRLEHPLLLLNQVSAGAVGRRLVLRLASGAAADVVLLHNIASGSRSNLGVEIMVAAGAALRLDEVSADHGELLTYNHASVAQDASLKWVKAVRGSRMARHATWVELTAAGADAHIVAANLAEFGTQVHHYLRMRHCVGNTTSRQLIKNVAADRGLASFDGLVTMDRGADESHADQQCRNLQLTDDARIGIRPQLDIQTDDVAATHGATIGRLNMDELLYLRSRGLDASTAYGVLVNGFLGEALDHCSSPLVATTSRDWLEIKGRA